MIDPDAFLLSQLSLLLFKAQNIQFQAQGLKFIFLKIDVQTHSAHPKRIFMLKITFVGLKLPLRYTDPCSEEHVFFIF